MIKNRSHMMDIKSQTVAMKDVDDSRKATEHTNGQKLMRCAEITSAGHPLKITSCPVPQVPDKGLLLKTLYGGICHSDVHFIDDVMDLGGGKIFKQSDVPGVKYSGIIPGHEICGVVEKLGQQVSSDHPVQPGDVIIVYPWQGCRQCKACLGEQSNTCMNTNGGTTDLGQGQHSGGYGSYVPVPDIDLCVKLPKNVRPEIGCMLPCGALTAFSALRKVKPSLDNAVRIRGVANLLLIGTGGLGMWAVIIAKQLFHDDNIKVVCVDIHQDKLDAALKLGADETVVWPNGADHDSVVATTTVNGQKKMDAAINFVGSSNTVQIAFDCLHYGGTIVMVGLYGGEYGLSLPVLVTRSISIQGMRVGGISNLRELVDLLAAQDMQVFPHTEIVCLDQVNEMIERLRKGKVQGRAIIKYNS